MKRREILKDLINGMVPIIEYYENNIYTGIKTDTSNERIELFNHEFDINNFNLKESVINKLNNDDKYDIRDLLEIMNKKLSDIEPITEEDGSNPGILLFYGIKIYFYREICKYWYFVRSLSDFDKFKSSMIKLISDKRKSLD